MSNHVEELQRQVLLTGEALDAFNARLALAESTGQLVKQAKALGLWAPTPVIDKDFLARRKELSDEHERLRQQLCKELCSSNPDSPACLECRNGQTCGTHGSAKGACACGYGGTCGCDSNINPDVGNITPDVGHVGSDFGQAGEELEVVRWLDPTRVLLRDAAGREAVGEVDDPAGDVAEKGQCGLSPCSPPDEQPEVERSRPRPGPMSRGSLGPRKALPGPGADFKELRRYYKSITRRTDKRGREFCFEGDAFHRVPCGNDDDQGDAAHGRAAGEARRARRGEKPPQAVPKRVARLGGFRSVARSRRVLAALRSEAELAQGTDGYNLPDSLPGDVLVAVGPGGELLQTKEQVDSFLATRAEAVKRLRADPSGPFAAEYRRVAEVPMALVEVKTLLTSARGEVHISAKAMRRKRAWEEKYNAKFHLIVKDARRGRKYSGHAWHHLPALQSTTHLEQMEKVPDFGAIYQRLLGGQVR